VADVERWHVTVEVFYDPTHEFDEATCLKQVADELARMGFVSSCDAAKPVTAKKLPAGFPLPSTKNIAAMDASRGRILEYEFQNLTLCGILAEPGQFFQRHVVRDVFDKLA